ncbi:MAG: hypothetical protein ACOX35_01860 [Bacillota bacterium]|jgi:hypothetical protein
MSNLFTPREIATGIWLFVFIVYVFALPNTRRPALKVIETALSPKLAVPFLVILLYAVVIVTVLAQMPFWKGAYLKDVVFWVLFTGVPLCYRVVESNLKDDHFRSMVIDTVKLTVVAEFILSSFTFGLLTEIVMLPVLTFFVICSVYVERKPEYSSVKSLIDGVLAVVGLGIFGFSLKQAIMSYKSIDTVDLLLSICMPIMLSTLYMPMAYAFAVYARYEGLFTVMGFLGPKDPKMRRKFAMTVIRTCRISYKKIDRFRQVYVWKAHASMTESEFRDLLDEFRDTEGP